MITQLTVPFIDGYIIAVCDSVSAAAVSPYELTKSNCSGLSEIFNGRMVCLNTMGEAQSCLFSIKVNLVPLFPTEYSIISCDLCSTTYIFSSVVNL